MLNAIIDWSLRHRFLVLALSLAFCGLGVWSLTNLNIDAFPDTTPVQVQINTIAPGLGAQVVERQITYPVEQAISGLPRLEQVRSVSKFGLSQVVVVFADGTDIYFARQMINERLATAEIPEGMPRPRMGPVATGLGEVFHYLVTTRPDARDELTEAEKAHFAKMTEEERTQALAEWRLRHLRTVQDWMIKPALRTVPGTAEINGWGGYEKQFQVRVDPQRLLRYNLTFDQVMQAVRDNNLTAGGGYLRQSGSMAPVIGLARTTTVKQLEKIVITTPESGVPVHLGDVAEVAIGHDIRLGGVTTQGQGEAVLGLGFMLMGENSHQVADRLREKLDEVKKNLPADVEVNTVYDRTTLVDQVIDTVRKNLFEGGLLVVAVLFVFLGNLRAGLIVALAIPVSMLFAFLGMYRFGIAGSLLSLGAIDFGLVVDSSVVMIENVVRHLAHDSPTGATPDGQLAHPSWKGVPPAPEPDKIEVVRRAAIEVRTPTMFGELIIMIVYLPILTLEGVEGKMFRPMALTVIFALVGSMILSLTLMPVLASLLLPRRLKETDPWLVRLARWIYAPLLHRVLRHGKVVIGGAVLAMGAAVLLARSLGSEFVPRLSEGTIVIGIMRLAGTDLDESLSYNTRMEQIVLEKFPQEVQQVWSRVGTAEVATDPMGPEETDFFITLKPRSQWRPEITSQDELVERIKEELKNLPGQVLSFTQPIEQRVNEMISGAKGDVAVKIFGDDFDVLDEKADEVVKILESVKGSTGIVKEQLSGQPVLEVQVDRAELARNHVPARAVMDLVEALGNRPLGEVIEGQMRFPLAARLVAKYRANPDAVGAILVTSSTGKRVPLSRLAKVRLVEGPSKISREWGQRRVIVQCNIDPSRDMGSFVAEARRKVDAKVKLPSGRYRITWGGQFENLERGKQRLLIVVPVALALIFGLLYITYNHLTDVFLVFTAVPFASVGGVLALWLRGLDFSISAGVGFIALSGVSVLNSMVLVTFIRQLRESGRPLDQAIEEAALTRLRPVLMTALVASLGFLPMALSTSVGAEVQRPLATVVIGGVISSTLLTLLVLPVLYHFFGPRGPAQEVRPELITEKYAVSANPMSV